MLRHLLLKNIIFKIKLKGKFVKSIILFLGKAPCGATAMTVTEKAQASAASPKTSFIFPGEVVPSQGAASGKALLSKKKWPHYYKKNQPVS